MKRILVTGAGGAPSYNFTQSLRDNPKKEKFYIVGVDTNKYLLELANVDKRYLVPLVMDSDYLSELNKIIVKEKIDFLHSQPDSEVYFLSKNKDKLKTKTLLPKFRTLELCQNKAKLNFYLRDKKVPVPEAYHITSQIDLEKKFSKLLKKNKKVWIRAVKGAGSKAALPVTEIEHAKLWIDYWKKTKNFSFEDFMVSEFLPGKEYAFQSLWYKGKLVSSQARERIEYLFGHLFPSGQSSSPSVAVTVNNNKVNDVASKAIRVVDNKATGVFCVDLKTDSKGRVVIMEINAGRFFTTSYFFSKAGCNMPYYYTLLGIDERIKIPLKAFNNLRPNLFWIRMVDMGYKLVRGANWTSKL